MLILLNGNRLTFREWATNMKRDMLASHIGHHSRLNYFSVIQNETSSRLKYKFINVKRNN
jgi:splicing factor 3B subunit 5